jgi:hypothetical protein
VISVAPELSAKYTLVSPNGFRAVFNDQTDVDYVGVVTEATGFDAPEIREDSENRPLTDGANHGRFLFGRRPMTISGRVFNATNIVGRTNQLAKLQSAVNDCVHSDGTLYWTLANGQSLYVNFRAQQPLRFNGNWVKDFQMALVAADPRIYAVDQSYAVQDSSYPAYSESDISFPGRYPFNNNLTAGVNFNASWPLTFNEGRVVYGGGVWAPNPGDQITYSVVATNNGSADAYPIISIVGPLTTASTTSANWITIRNATTRKVLVFNAPVLTANSISIDMRNQLISLNGVNSYSSLDPLVSDWWTLAPGDNRVTVQTSAPVSLPGTPATFQIAWQNAWL